MSIVKTIYLLQTELGLSDILIQIITLIEGLPHDRENSKFLCIISLNTQKPSEVKAIFISIL